MSNDYRNESKRRPPSPRYGTPGTLYPTPNPYDQVITEEVTNRAQAFEPVLYGTPHPVVAAAVLCHQSHSPGNSTDKGPIRVYANPRLAQEPYNLVRGDSEEEDPDFPVFVRSYLLPRGYARGTPGQPLKALIGLTLSAGGAGYVPASGTCKLPLAFSGGAGTGAAGFAEIVAGVVVAVVLTNTGSGYTSAPTVSLSGGGSGATITALLQPATALLTKEAETSAEEPYAGYFVRVERTWETVPGPPITATHYDPESDTNVTVVRTKKLTSAITVGSTISGTSAITTEAEQIDALFSWQIVTTFPQSPFHSLATAKVEYSSRPYQFPTRVDVTKFDLVAGVPVGLRKPTVDGVIFTTKTWWVNDVTEPTLALDSISYGDTIRFPNGFSFGDCIHDDATIVYPDLGSVSFPATTPSYTNFTSGGGIWIGTPRIIHGEVRADKHANRWRVEQTTVVMQ